VRAVVAGRVLVAQRQVGTIEYRACARATGGAAAPPFQAAIAVGIIGKGASEAVGRNPEASTKVLVQSILAIAFAEAIVFYALFLVK